MNRGKKKRMEEKKLDRKKTADEKITVDGKMNICQKPPDKNPRKKQPGQKADIKSQ